ncbi:MAG: hypothetical protein EAZ79_21680 [Oscillatoriales cyanobacterium]|nr:MAG: hypothetical protein EAZ79_21680 [Oscillatoriales cyanobacterium]
MMNSQDFLTSGDGYSPNKQTDLLKTTHDVCVGVPASSHDVSSVQEFQGDLTASDYVSIHQWFEAQVKQTPDAIALSFQGQELISL